jgi:hypothetical protein
LSAREFNTNGQDLKQSSSAADEGYDDIVVICVIIISHGEASTKKIKGGGGKIGLGARLPRQENRKNRTARGGRSVGVGLIGRMAEGRGQAGGRCEVWRRGLRCTGEGALF